MYSNAFWNNISKSLGKRIGGYGSPEYSGGAASNSMMQTLNRNNMVIQNKPASLRYGDDDSMEGAKEEAHGVDSTAVNSVAYDPKTEEMSIQFTNNPTEYDFVNVPKDKFKDFMKSSSKGRYTLSEFIHNPSYHKAGPWDNK